MLHDMIIDGVTVSEDEWEAFLVIDNLDGEEWTRYIENICQATEQS